MNYKDPNKIPGFLKHPKKILPTLDLYPTQIVLAPPSVSLTSTPPGQSGTGGTDLVPLRPSLNRTLRGESTDHDCWVYQKQSNVDKVSECLSILINGDQGSQSCD